MDLGGSAFATFVWSSEIKNQACIPILVMLKIEKYQPKSTSPCGEKISRLKFRKENRPLSNEKQKQDLNEKIGLESFKLTRDILH